MHDEVGAVLERAQVDRRRRGRVDHDAGGMRSRGLEVRHGQERIRRRFEPDHIRALGRRTRLVELDVAHAPRRQRLEQPRGPVVRAVRDRDRLAGPQLRQYERRYRAGAGREEERCPAFERSELALGLDACGVSVALVSEAARVSVLVGPDRGAVDAGHRADSTF